MSTSYSSTAVAGELKRAKLALELAEFAETAAAGIKDATSRAHLERAARTGDQAAYGAIRAALEAGGCDTGDLPTELKRASWVAERDALAAEMRQDLDAMRRTTKTATRPRPPLRVKGWASTSRRDGNWIGENVDLTPAAWHRAGERFLENGRPLLLAHDPSQPLGRVVAATASPTGLFIEAVIDEPKTKAARDAYDLVASGAAPLGFSVGLDRIASNGTTIVGADLVEISVGRSANRDCRLVVCPT